MRIRVVHGADPIPAMPPPWRYSHFQPTVFLKKGGKLELIPGGWWGNRRLGLALADHYMFKYLGSLQTALALPGAGSVVQQQSSSSSGGDGGGEATESKEGLKKEEEAEVEAMAAAVSSAPFTWLRCAAFGGGRMTR